ncbi:MULTISPECIES: 4-hydroxythreonine-4-phosphate dehydrogenase PdxA [Mammaliicoccus]|uniref:4-hydroxythreonine-4-phosphate dehydrogenase PdxA n=1 Tax=Mammaliicoccus lentus TaxID=42858 RepID=A0ABS6GY51_MAMLE|nr:4-hydroxythreonine-4-phosphate dehydrogenase PdxA [Mammaliicoccus lentus]MBU6114379.1 4-hydroxythreonine-4-phosphate dehydrogenase PdxA [Mammaliicoccus lentus]MCD2478031.1 4-hydroxythreonine-4-phosphate dehydrogenase PdxA [Mammaliicoccus lentus]MCD2521201.1 4-hydroxythreonine-4-phosphate dehydrogenase PdxA [Mammaliicoccus lentus]MEB5686595.1 4-hydroxythreonine-4-phosphate dehydrogenase PdxA [Mammaliicoccus lentus]
MKKPIIGITMGDPSGVGPEIIVKSLNNEELYNRSHPIVIGDSKRLLEVIKILNLNLEVKSISENDDFETTKFGEIKCLDLNLLPDNIEFGQINLTSGDAAFKYLSKAINLANSKRLDAICTAPLNKEAMQKAGHLYPGHTEILADLTNTDNYAMMLSSPKLKVIHVTTHVGLIEAINQIKPERVFDVIKMADVTLKNSGIENPKIGVCGINPHAGENGLFGNGEEEEKIDPAIKQAKDLNINVEGPLPADTLFFRAQRGDFDIVIAMYHDQGHGPIKVLGLEAGVNITVGLPIIRTSVDHGTAFDIAGKGIVDERSMNEALNQAILLAPVK